MKAQSAYYKLPHGNGYDALEIHTVLLAEEFAEALSSGEETSESKSLCWSLYGHASDEGVECIGDFNSFEAACQVAEKLGGIN